MLTPPGLIFRRGQPSSRGGGIGGVHRGSGGLMFCHGEGCVPALHVYCYYLLFEGCCEWYRRP